MTLCKSICSLKLLPFNGTNHHSVVIMDNCSIHHIDEVVAMIEDVGDVGAIVLLLATLFT